MNLALFIKQPILKKILLKQLAYYADGWYVFENKKLSNDLENIDNQEACFFKKTEKDNAKVVIVAKAHYQQTLQSYTSISKKELRQILLLQKSNENTAATIFQIAVNAAIDGYDIKKTTFDSRLLNELGEQRVLIPETDLFCYQNESQSGTRPIWLSTIETPVGTLFASCFGDISSSSYAKGLISNVEAFKLSSGLPADIISNNVAKEDYANFLFTCFTQSKIDVLYNKIAFNPKKWFKAKDLHLLYWAPLITASIFYIATNSYLWIKSNNIENELSDQGDAILELLESKYKQDQQRQLLNMLNNEFSKTVTVHQHWSLIYQLVESGMVISRFNYTLNILTIRGKAPNATKVLTEISKSPFVVSATFKGAVRKSKGKESFTLELIPNNISDERPINKETSGDIKVKLNTEGKGTI